MVRSILLFFFIGTSVLFSATFNATVVRVVDGDSIHVKTVSNERKKIRLFGIDAPEIRQRDGAKSGRYLAVRLGDKTVQVVPQDTDVYGRLVATVFDEYGQNINEEMIRLGLAWVYVDYTQNNEWMALEKMARDQRIGLWRRKNPMPPWKFRNKNSKKK